MTILRLAHIDIEGLTLDSQVRALRDQVSQIILPRVFVAMIANHETKFVTHNWTTCCKL